ncbi:MAG: lysophospholipid acyltransferase family protein [Pseudomonadota bacterium]
MLRSVLFALAFYVTTAVFVIGGSPLLFGPRAWAMAGLRTHARACLWLLRVICNTRVEVRGLEHLPAEPALIAAKHQSAWDTFALIPLFRDPALVMKAELGRIPFYGWFSRKFEHILVERGQGARALRKMVSDAQARSKAGRDILIFPEGTRQAPGAPADYKPGVAALNNALDGRTVPVALNSGLYWPRRTLRRYPGTIIVELLPPLPAGLKRQAYQAALETALERASDALLDEAAAGATPPPTVEAALHHRAVDRDHQG